MFAPQPLQFPSLQTPGQGSSQGFYSGLKMSYGGAPMTFGTVGNNIGNIVTTPGNNPGNNAILVNTRKENDPEKRNDAAPDPADPENEINSTQPNNKMNTYISTGLNNVFGAGFQVPDFSFGFGTNFGAGNYGVISGGDNGNNSTNNDALNAFQFYNEGSVPNYDYYGVSQTAVQPPAPGTPKKSPQRLPEKQVSHVGSPVRAGGVAPGTNPYLHDINAAYGSGNNTYGGFGASPQPQKGSFLDDEYNNNLNNVMGTMLNFVGFEQEGKRNSQRDMFFDHGILNDEPTLDDPDDPSRVPTFVKVRGLPEQQDPRIQKRRQKKKNRCGMEACLQKCQVMR